jgi:hypothetical protein
MDSPFVKQLPVKKFENLLVLGFNQEAFASRDSPLIENFVNFKTPTLPPEGLRFLGVFVFRVTLHNFHASEFPKKSNWSGRRH